nr:hypothetical protein [uncultured Actinoplanes sp.]
MSVSFDLGDPRQRALHALAQQNRPTPRRGVVPEAAVPGAEACVRALRVRFALLTAGASSAPGGPEIDAALRSAGLLKITVRAAGAFAASTGEACIYGSFGAAGPEFAIGPVATGGACR